MVTTKLNLSMTEPQVRQIYAKQGDTGRVLDISLDQTPEDGTLRILRPDGVEVTSEAVTGGEVSESGETVTFDSLTEADVTELTVGIEPVQDLNGYDKPWVGGAGKNLLDPDVFVSGRSQYYNVNSDGSINVVANDSTAWNNVPYIPLKSGTYTLSWVTQPSGQLRMKTSDDGYSAESYIGAGNKRYTFTLTDDGGIKLKIGINASYPYTEYLQIEIGSTTTSYSPYSNICPITGHDEVTAYDDPVYDKAIKWNQLIKNGNFADTSNWITWGGTITVSGNVATVTTPGQWNQLSQVFDWTYGHIMLAMASVKKVGESGSISVKVVNDFAYTNQQFARAITTNDEWTDVVLYGKYTVTPSDSTAQVRWGVQEYRSANSNNGFQIKNVGVFDLTEMFGEGNEPTVEEFDALFPKDYYPYNTGEETTVSAVNGDPNRQYTTSLGQTVYGGTLDLVSGVLTVTHALGVLDGTGSLGYIDSQSGSSYTTAYVHTADFDSVIDKTASGISNRFEVRNASLWGTDVVALQIANSASSVRLRIPKSLLATENVDGARAWLTANPVQIYYKLATPVTYTLTAQQIKTLVGTNNVWASSGDIVSIKFSYGGLLSELPSEATEIVGKCYCDVEQNGVSSMPFTLNVKKNERES